MFIRTVVVGLGLALCLCSSAYAETTPTKTYLFPSKASAEAAPEKPAKKLSAKERRALKKAQAAADKKALAAAAKREKARQAAEIEQAQFYSASRRLPPMSNALVEPVSAGPFDDAAPAMPVDVVASGNNGELRSEQPGRKQDGFFTLLFGGAPEIRMLPETQALDAAMAARESRRKFKVKDDFVPQEVGFSGYPAGTLVIDTGARYLYLVESRSVARRYAIAVGKQGLQFKGEVKVGDKQEWPRWIPTKEMQEREPSKYGQYKDGMAGGGGDNPLGARAIYLYDGKKDTHLRIHGTNAPQTIGTSSSNGCFRMINEHVMDLYRRVPKGTRVVIL